MKPSRRPDAGSPAGAGAGTSGDVLHGRRVILCITGGIAAYKSAYLTRALVKAGALVHVVMSRNAPRFVTPLTFETLSGNPVVGDSFERVHAMGAVEHIDLALWAELVLVAPASYDFLGKLNAGIADDAVTTLLAAVRVPVFLVPSMNDHMWRNPINQRNVKALDALGYRFVDPERGPLACVWEGEGRMREPDAIVDAVRAALRQPEFGMSRASGAEAVPAAAPAAAPAATPVDSRGALAGRTILISAAGTREAIDPVRFVGNRSSGKMGFALAAEAVRRGARVRLVSGPTHLEAPAGVADFVRVEAASEMLAALEARIADCDVLLMAAAVADYRPRQVAGDKLKRGAGPLRLELEPTPDLLATLASRKGERTFVGFALETGDPEAAARGKLERKGLDLIVANRVGPGTGFDTDTNQVWIYDAAGLVLETPVVDKHAVATAILDVVETRLAKVKAKAEATRR